MRPGRRDVALNSPPLVLAMVRGPPQQSPATRRAHLLPRAAQRTHPFLPPCRTQVNLMDSLLEDEQVDFGDEDIVSPRPDTASPSERGAAEAGSPKAGASTSTDGETADAEAARGDASPAADAGAASGGETACAAPAAGSQPAQPSASAAPAGSSERGWPSKKLPARTRFFVMKSFCARDLKISMQKSIWATQQRNEAKLNEAYEGSDAVVLFFSVNESRAFQGYARMDSKTGASEQVWTAQDGTQSWGGVFKVKWQTIYDCGFGEVSHLTNALNENKPVKICRDGQEVEPGVARDLCSIIDHGYAANSLNTIKNGKDKQSARYRIRPKTDRTEAVRSLGESGLLQAERRYQPGKLLHHDPAAERHRQPAHGPRVPADHHGHHDSLSAHAG